MNERKPECGETSDPGLEQRMADSGLSEGTRRFLRDLHAAEKQINEVFEKAHRGDGRQAQLGEAYRRMYGADGASAPVTPVPRKVRTT
ncbi:hypothetical protein DEO45_10000 [Rhodanobacter denitrificans]|uniref:Uncharacterized protein n=1 Tax=Rhodanobacter denitrificans TaxID=666685 RepID=A0A368KC44_9GAMM|nr:hypothetical protein [Rhodanobacter denitrificans]RCS29501.1 hypothetical protein DEO45_10000 [Rhodanobacter denitrificans]